MDRRFSLIQVIAEQERETYSKQNFVDLFQSIDFFLTSNFSGGTSGKFGA
jgi:hypothetical protein